MILDFDLTEARERPISVNNAPGSIIVGWSFPRLIRRSGAFWTVWAFWSFYICHPAGGRERVPAGNASLFFAFYAIYTTYIPIFCAIIQIKKILKKPIDTRRKVWYNIVTARDKTKMILENWTAAGRKNREYIIRYIIIVNS